LGYFATLFIAATFIDLLTGLR